MSSHGRRRAGSEPAGPAQSSPAQWGWALLVIAAALVGGLAAATLVHASLTIAVIASVVIGVIGAAAVFRAPASRPTLTVGAREDADTGRSVAPPSAPTTATRTRTVPRSRSPRPAPEGLGPAAAGGQASRVVPPGASSAAPPESFDDPVAPAAGGAPTKPRKADGQDHGGGPPGGSETVVELLPLGSQPGTPDAPWWDSAQGAPPSPSPGARRAPAPDLSTYLASTFIAQCPRCGAFRLDIRRAGNAMDFRCQSCDHTWTWQPGTPWPPVRVVPP